MPNFFTPCAAAKIASLFAIFCSASVTTDRRGNAPQKLPEDLWKTHDKDRHVEPLSHGILNGSLFDTLIEKTESILF